LTPEALLAIPKEDMPRAAEALGSQDIPELVNLLDEKADEKRYQALLLLTARSERFPDVCVHWPRFRAKLTSANSYQRSIGILMIAANARWAGAEAIQEALPDCLKLTADEKPITARQAIQSLGKIAGAVPEAAPRIIRALMGLDLLAVRETMRKLTLMDICRAISKPTGDPELEDVVRAYLMSALSGDILDKAAKKELRSEMAL
jgi:hypothetical protein